MIDDVLIPLRPVTDFDKLLFAQAAIKDLKKRLSESMYEIGQLRSEIDRLEFENKELRRNLNDISLAARDPNQTDYKRRYMLHRYRNTKLEKKIRALREVNTELICKIARLEKIM